MIYYDLGVAKFAVQSMLKGLEGMLRKDLQKCAIFTVQ